MTELTAVVTVFAATESLVAVLAEESLGTVCVLAALVCWFCVGPEVASVDAMEGAAATLLAGCAAVLMELESDPCDELGAEESDVSDVAAAVLDAVCEFDGLVSAALARPDMEAT